ncbi:MAG TPA: hypothetical protein EYP86_01615 [Candidatus Altiarchaeales archaeon]|nr:hypothetical protein [Candidatus Altiarchaeales archaeon]
MPAKPQRNALIIKLWNEGKSNQEILTALKRAGHKDLKDTHSLSGVIARLKRRGKLPKERPQEGLTKIEREGIRELAQATRGLIKFQVGKTSEVMNFRTSEVLTFKVPKYKKLIPITVRLREDQITALEQMVKEIMQGRDPQHRKERITKNTLIRAFIDLLTKVNFDKHNIESEEELKRRLIR